MMFPRALPIAIVLAIALPALLATAVFSSSARAAFITSGGTQSGNGISSTMCFPFSVWTSRIAANRSFGRRSASPTMAGHKRRCSNVTLPLTNRQVWISSDCRTSRVSR